MGSPTLSSFGGISYRNLSKEESSPLISSRRDAMTCAREYSCDWSDAYDFQLALRGICQVTPGTVTASSIFQRTTPHNFMWGKSRYPFVCQDIAQIKPSGLLHTRTGTTDPRDVTKASTGQFTTSELDADETLIVPADKAHFQVDYAAVRYPLAEDDETNEPVLAADQTATSLTYNEWDRYCDWTMEWGVETLTAPIGAYSYVDYNQPINSYVQFQAQVATLTCKVWGLPTIPMGAQEYPGTVNHKAFTVFFNQETTFRTFAAETLLFQPPAVEYGYMPDLSVSFNLTYRFVYRPQKHNFFFYYPGRGTGSGSGSGGLRWSWKRIALDISNPTADGSAPFSLRNFGYLWSPQNTP